MNGLIAALAVDNPLTSSRQGLDDGCFWCGARKIYARVGVNWAEHEPRCPWIAARRYLDLPIGPHTVRADIDTDVAMKEWYL